MSDTKKRRQRPGEAAAQVRAGNPVQLLVARRMIELGIDGKPLSLQDVVDRSGRRDGHPRVGKMTVSNVLRGYTIRLRPETVKALAKALTLDEDTLRMAIDQSVTLTMELPERLQKLSPDGWADLLAYGDFLLTREGKNRT